MKPKTVWPLFVVHLAALLLACGGQQAAAPTAGPHPAQLTSPAPLSTATTVPPTQPSLTTTAALTPVSIGESQQTSDKNAPQAQALNVVLLIADGMGFAHLEAARLWKGGPDDRLAMDELPFQGQVTTHSLESPVTDSAAAATAIATGHKTLNGYVSVASDGVTELSTVLEQAQRLGKSVGVVVTSSLTHATPAAFYAHVDTRNPQNLIALQAIERKPDLMLGGGARHFIAQDDVIATTADGPEAECASRRKDSRDVLAEARASGYSVVMTRTEFLSLDSLPVLGLFACANMSYDLSRQPEEPSLAEITARAIELLGQDPDGFFLMVEGSRIDHASHANDGQNAIGDTVAFDEAVRVAFDFARAHGQTLVVATSDHETGGLEVLSTPELPAASVPGSRAEVIEALSGASIGLQWSTTEHTEKTVPIAAFGPAAELAAGLLDNTDVYRLMANALGIEAEPVIASGPSPSPTPRLPLEEACSAEIEPIEPEPGYSTPTEDGLLRIGLTGHANFWWMGKTPGGHTNVDRARLVAQVMNEQRVDFTVWLGDDFRLCDQPQLERFIQAVSAFQHPVLKVLSNHDMDDNHGEKIHPLQRERFRALFGRDIYWYQDFEGYRLIFLADESAVGDSYISEAQVEFLADVLATSPHPVLVFAHHVLPVRERELLNAMIGSQSRNTVKILDLARSSGKVIFWGWIHHHSRGRDPVQSRGIVEYSPHFITGYVGEKYLDSLETTVLTVEGGVLKLEVFDAFTSTTLKSFYFPLPAASQ